jgi:murein DD-endopeptidase MepM/ murein hydrolase activator NlpD
VGDDDLLGHVVEINHGNGFTSLYGHLGEVLVKERQVVRTGEVIAEVGTTGITNGPHLHLEIKERGVNVDPAIRLGVVEEPLTPVLGPAEVLPAPRPADEAAPGPTVRTFEGAEGAEG